MYMLEKIGSWFQVVASVFFALFTILQIVRALYMHYEVFYIICFVAMLFLSFGLLGISVAELIELK